ncbi:F-box domain-containing protein [Mycena chlorophos]|uniref:F-box domain-containing protein n=1 Tax=Mycena chlorophos TaxID=658473 RepID=A0A8H6SCP9_MYCCL|nr:F-box domain-containing protein [Mycena chlorophos]
MVFHSLFSRVLALATVSSVLASLPTSTVYQSPAELPFENIAVRASGQLLLTSVYSPILYSLDASSGVLTNLVTVGNGSTALLGISEYQKDVFAVVASQFDATTDTEIGGTVQIWSVDLTGSSPAATKVSSLPSTVIGANGLSAIFGSNTIFVADSGSGTVFSVNMASGAFTSAVQATALEPVGSLLGINGLKVSSDGTTLFYTNSAVGTFGSIPIPPPSRINAGTALNSQAITVLGDLEDGAATSAHLFDDFALDSKARPCMGPGSSFTETDDIVGDAADYNVLVVPTSCAFGRTSSDQQTLYVTTDGGAVVAVDTSSV